MLITFYPSLYSFFLDFCLPSISIFFLSLVLTLSYFFFAKRHSYMCIEISNVNQSISRHTNTFRIRLLLFASCNKNNNNMDTCVFSRFSLSMYLVTLFSVASCCCLLLLLFLLIFMANNHLINIFRLFSLCPRISYSFIHIYSFINSFI